MNEPRYQVCSIEGFYELGPKVSVTYWISDSLYGFREVAWFRPARRVLPETRRKRAERRCAELNAAHDAWKQAA